MEIRKKAALQKEVLTQIIFSRWIPFSAHNPIFTNTLCFPKQFYNDSLLLDEVNGALENLPETIRQKIMKLRGSTIKENILYRDLKIENNEDTFSSISITEEITQPPTIEFTAQANAEKRDRIICILTNLDLPTETVNSVKEKLDSEMSNAKNISIPAYLDQYLIPLIPELNRMRKARDSATGIKNTKEWEMLISLCFLGDVSQKVWDAVWTKLNEDEKIYHMTASYSENPLTLAATHGNMPALRRLDAFYQALLPKQPDRHRRLHDQLKDALREMPKRMTTNEHKTAYLFLLSMCGKYAFIDPMAKKIGFSNKNFVENENTMLLLPLLDVFDRICKHYSHQRCEYKENAWAIHQLSLYVEKNGTPQEYRQFEKNLLNRLKKNPSLQEEVSKLQEKPEATLLEKGDGILISLDQDSEPTSFSEPVKPNIEGEQLILSTDTSIQRLAKTQYHNLFSNSVPESISESEQKKIRELESEIRSQVAIYDSKINTEKKARFPSRKDIELWEKKKNVLNFACELLLDEKTEPASLQSIEKANPGWDKGKEAKGLVNRVKALRGWEDDHYPESLSSFPLLQTKTKK